MYISSHLNNKENNFNLIRFIAAFLVIYAHSYSLSGGEEPIGQLLNYSLGTFAVDVFFVTSGFLIMGSLINSKSLIVYVKKRALRIYPALAVVVFLCTFILGPIVSQLSIASYFNQSEVYRYFFKSITLLTNVGTHLPGVFLDNPWPKTVNGSLWTLPYEIYLYIILAVVVYALNLFFKLIGIEGYERLSFLLVTVFLFVCAMFSYYSELPFFRYFKLSLLFFSGSLFYYFSDKIYLSKRLFIIFLSLGLLSFVTSYDLYAIYFLLLPYLLLYVSFEIKTRALTFNKLGDYSYGLYIYSFPVQQTLAYIDNDISTLSMIVYSSILSLILAIMSWHLIEKRFLYKKKSNISTGIAENVRV